MNVAEASASFVARLYSQPSLPRSYTQEIINSVQSFLHHMDAVEACYRTTSANVNPDIKAMFVVLRNAFSDHETEHRSMQYFKNLNFLIEPEEVSVGTIIGPKYKSEGTRMAVSNRKICIISLERIFRNFLELPGVYDTILEYRSNSKQSNTVTNYLQGSLWRSTEKIYENVVLPLIVYFDDLEINNPLGTHRGVHKLGAVYCSIGCIPERYSSRLENIFLVQLHNSTDYADLGNKQMFSRLIDQITKLQTDGITISVENVTHKVSFALLYIAGDNLGLNAIFGFTTSFNSHYSCRFCHVEKAAQKIQTMEDPKLLRTIESYEKDVQNQSRGVKERCVLNSIPNFHNVDNISIDPMHDIFEGVCRYELGKLLHTFIVKDKLFSLETLNSRLRFFDYGIKTSANIPPVISIDTMKKGHLIYSASEMACFVQNLGLIIGDLVPKENKTWKIYILLRKIISIILASTVTLENITALKSLMTKHHR